MGFIYQPHGDIAIEGRRESFIIHDEKDNNPHPEFYLTDLDDLITALLTYKNSVHSDGGDK